ncbi:MAG: hypothetical protein M3Z04_23315 [Chloroflexota bacterium]|nr:hypothetical protein [Chloroflexota bacterium]
MTNTLAHPDTAEAIPEFPPDFPVGFAAYPIARLKQVWDFLPPETQTRVVEMARTFRMMRSELTALEQAIPQDALEAANERRTQMLQRWEERADRRDPTAAEAEWEAIKQGLDANRAANGERLLFP